MPNNILITPGTATIDFSGSMAGNTLANTLRLQVLSDASVVITGSVGQIARFFPSGQVWVTSSAQSSIAAHQFTGSLGIVSFIGTASRVVDGAYRSEAQSFSALQTFASGVALNDSNITGVNSITINDPGVGEGILWAGGNLWRIYESPNTLTNAAGNLQIVQNSTRRATFNTSGQFEIPVATGTAPFVVASTTVVTNLNADLLDGYNTAIAGTASTVVVRDASGGITGSLFGNATTATSASNVLWQNVGTGTRTNYNLDFKPPTSDYAGFRFSKSTSANGAGDAGYLLIRGTSDTGVYTAEGITLVADGGWLTLAQRTTAARGVRIMTGTTAATRALFYTDGTVEYTGATFNYSNTAQVLFNHTGNSTPVPFEMRKAGTSNSDGGDYGTLTLSRTNHTNASTSVGSNLYFSLKDSGGTLREYAGIGGRKTEAGAAGGALYFYRYARTVMGWWDSEGLKLDTPQGEILVTPTGWRSSVRAAIKVRSKANEPAELDLRRTEGGREPGWHFTARGSGESGKLDLYKFDQTNAGVPDTSGFILRYTFAADGSFTATNTVTATQFIDSDNTAYLVDPFSISRLNQARFQNRISVGDGNGTPFLNTGSPGVWLSYNGNSNIFMGAETTTQWGVYIATGWEFRVNGDGDATATRDMYANRFIDANNNAFLVDPASTSVTNYFRTVNLYDSAERRYTSPGGSVFTTSTATVTGAIRIRLPANRRNSSTMLRFTVKVYEYSTGRSSEFQIGGYNYSLGGWINVFATQLTDAGRGPFTIRWGDDGTNDYVCIAETGTTWSYPQVFITDLQVGYSGFSTNWGDGWAIDFVTTLPAGVEVTRTASLIVSRNNASNYDTDLYATRFIDVNDTNYLVDPRSASRMSGLRLDGVDNQASGEDAILWINKPNNNDWGIIITGNLDYGADFRMANGAAYALRVLGSGDERWRVRGDGNTIIRNTAPTITFRDTDNNSAFIHVNSNIFYILRGAADVDHGNWAQINGVWPLEINLTNNNAQFGGNVYIVGNARFFGMNSTGTWGGNMGTGQGKLEYHSNRWYVNAGSNSTEIVRFRRGGTDLSWIDNSGTYIGNISGNAGSANQLPSFDTRATVTTPQTHNNIIRFDFRENSANGLSDGGTYNGVMYWRKYGGGGDWSGGGAVEIGYSDNARLWMRYGSGTSWGGWKRIIFGDNFDNGGIIRTSSNVRAARFEDVGNTGFFVDPADGGFNLRGGSSNRVTYTTNDSGIIVNNAEGNGQGEVRLGAAWGRPGIYSPNYVSIGTSGGYTEFVFGNVQRAYVNSSGVLYAASLVDYNNNNYYVDPAGGNARIGRDIYVEGFTGGNFGNRIVVGATSTPYTLQDGNIRPTVYLRGQYPVLTLDHTVTSNTNHGPTIQFVHNGLGNRQWVFGSTGDGISLDIGFSNSGLGNTNFNPHNGIAGWTGATYMRFRENGFIGLGRMGNWGGLGGGDPSYHLHFIGTHNSGHAALFRNATNASNGAGFIFVNTFGNHSWGVVAEFRIEGASDRPSILFSSAQTGTTWSVGYGQADDNFRIAQNLGHRNGGWGTERFRINTDGTLYFFNSTYTYGTNHTYGRGFISKSAHGPGANDYHLEIYSDNTGNSSNETSIRFHQGGQYWGQLRYRAGGFRFTDGSSDSLTTVTVGDLTIAGGFNISTPGSGYAQFNNWVRVNGSYFVYSGTNSAHFYPNNGSYGAWRIDGSRNGWNGIEFSGSTTQVSLMSEGNGNTVGWHANSYGWKFRVAGGTAYMYKGFWGGSTEAVVLDSSNYTGYTIPIGGGWYGSGLPGSRWYGYSVNGGEIVFGRDLPNNGQMGILIDGAYVAGENNGFWSLASDNTWGSRRGFFWDGGRINFTTNNPAVLITTLRTDRVEAFDSTLIYRVGISTGSTRHINLIDSTGDPCCSIGEGGGTGISWGQRTDSQPYYIIRMSNRNFGGSSYTKLTLNWHTGLIFGANAAYGGIRFYSDAYPISQSLLVYINGPSNYNYFYTWTQLTGHHGIYSGINNAHFYPNPNSYGSWLVIGTRNGWAGLEFSDSNTTLMMNTDTYGFHWNSVGWRFYVSGASGYFPGNVVAYWSDKRLKEDIRPLEVGEGLNVITRLVPSRFKWREQAALVSDVIPVGKEEVSIIAQATQEVLPEAVVVNKTGKKVSIDDTELTEYLTINYDKISPYLIQAIKDLKAEVDELKQSLKKVG